MSDQQLPHTDPDLKLAQAIDRARSTGTSLSELKDPLIPELLKHQKQLHQRSRVDYSAKQDVWQKIANATEPSAGKAPIRPLFTVRNFRWAAAAVVLIGALISIIYFQMGQQPELLAQSGADVKTVQLSDGSTVTLRPHSQLSAIKQTASTLLYELEGEAFFEVTPKQQRTFSVQTETGRVSVLGTQFILSSWGNRMQVFLKEGSVRVQPRQKDSALALQPGEAAAVIKDGDITYISQANAREFTDWLDQKLFFESKTAGRIARELEQEFNISISLPDKVAARRLSGQLSLENLQTSLNDLTLVLGGTFVHTGERNYRFESR